jgi:hypothetical protein
MRARRLILSVFALTLGVLALTSAPTLAASAPTLGEESVLNVSGDSATLLAEVNPEGSSTTYQFEYGTSESYGQDAPSSEALLGAGTSTVSVEAHVQGLAPGTTYHFRVVASNAGGVMRGADQTFTTQHDDDEFVLPDGRQYEMATPPEKQGALFYWAGQFGIANPVGFKVQASATGDAIVDEASQPTEAGPPGYGDPDMSVLSTRGPDGWSSQDISPPRYTPSGTGNGLTEDVLFSEDLSLAAVQPWGAFDPLSPEASERTPYLRTDYMNGYAAEHCQESCFEPLVTRADDTANPFQPFGESACESYGCGPAVVDATPDLSHLIVSTPVKLTSAPVETENGLYEWSQGQLQLISIPPVGEQITGEVAPAGDINETSVNDQTHARSAVSNNGSRVSFETVKGNYPTALYLHDVEKGETIRLDVPEPGCGECTDGSNLKYMAASSDDSRVFFLDTGRLTKDSGDHPEIPGEIPGIHDLYECKIVEVAGKLRCDLTDLTPERNGESADVVSVLGFSADGSYLYFAAGGALASGAAPATCELSIYFEELENGESCNIYVSHNGAISLVATGWMPDADYEAAWWARVSPSGQWLAFMSPRSLTGYDNRDANNGVRDMEVYLYDADTGDLTCASCDPTGARPVALHTGDLETENVVGSLTGKAVRAGEPGNSPATLYQPRYLSDSGRLFFEDEDALVPQDVNGTIDVYEYEPEGVPSGEHSCSAASSSGSEVYRPARSFVADGRGGQEGAGCVALISSGTSSEESSFLDASETGGDVFFLTTSKLLPQDFDNAYDVYDAHECSTAVPCPAVVQTPPQCTTEASCRTTPSPQPLIYGAPPSATFNGAGNVTPTTSQGATKPKSKRPVKCKHGFAKKRGRCVRAKAKKTRSVRRGPVKKSFEKARG